MAEKLIRDMTEKEFRDLCEEVFNKYRLASELEDSKVKECSCLTCPNHKPPIYDYTVTNSSWSNNKKEE